MSSVEDQRSELRDLLLEKSVCFGEFTLVSGAKSDFYVDSKLTTLDPRGARLIGALGWEVIKNRIAETGCQVDAVGGLTMGADPIALAVALHSESEGRPLQTVAIRKEPKKHGRNKLIEGNFKEGDSVVVIDDVVTTGGSTIKAIEAIEESGGAVAFVLVLVDRQEGGAQNIEKLGHHVEALFRREDLAAASETESAASKAE